MGFVCVTKLGEGKTVAGQIVEVADEVPLDAIEEEESSKEKKEVQRKERDLYWFLEVVFFPFERLCSFVLYRERKLAERGITFWLTITFNLIQLAATAFLLICKTGWMWWDYTIAFLTFYTILGIAEVLGLVQKDFDFE